MKFSEFAKNVNDLCLRDGMVLEAIGQAPKMSSIDVFQSGRPSERPMLSPALAVMRLSGVDASTYQVAAAHVDKHNLLQTPYSNSLVTSWAERTAFKPRNLREGADVEVAQMFVGLRTTREQALGDLSICYAQGAPYTLRFNGIQTTPAALALVEEQLM